MKQLFLCTVMLLSTTALFSTGESSNEGNEIYVSALDPKNSHYEENRAVVRAAAVGVEAIRMARQEIASRCVEEKAGSSEQNKQSRWEKIFAKKKKVEYVQGWWDAKCLQCGTSGGSLLFKLKPAKNKELTSSIGCMCDYRFSTLSKKADLEEALLKKSAELPTTDAQWKASCSQCGMGDGISLLCEKGANVCQCSCAMHVRWQYKK